MSIDFTSLHKLYVTLSFYPKDADLKMTKTQEAKAEISMVFFGTLLMYYHRPFPKNSRCLWVTLKRESNMFYYLENTDLHMGSAKHDDLGLF